MILAGGTYKMFGLSIKIDGNNITGFNLVLAQIKRVNVEIIDSWDFDNAGFDKISSVFSAHEKGIPIALNITGPKILVRELNREEKESFDKQFKNESFWIDTLLVGENYLCSVIRTDLLRELTTKLSSPVNRLVNVSLLGFSLSELAPYIEDYPIQLGSILFQDDKTIKYVDLDETNQSLLGIDSKDLISFSAILRAVNSDNNSQPKYISEGAQEFWEKKKTNKVLKYFGLSILGILLVNYFVFDYYYAKNQQIQQFISLSQPLIDEYAQLSSSFELRKEYVQINQLNKASKLSFYADDIARLLPPGITLTTMEVFPVTKQKRSGKFQVKDQIIQVNGYLNKGSLFDVWTKALNKCNWVKQVNVHEYDNVTVKNHIVFSISIIINEHV